MLTVRTHLIGILSCAVTVSVPLAGEGEVRFVGLRAAYQKLSEVRGDLQNRSNVRINLDPLESDRVVIERWNPASRTWEPGDGLRCFYSFSDGPASIAPRGKLEIDVSRLKAFHDDAEGISLDLKSGETRPGQGRYRLRVQYSTHAWSPFEGYPDSGDIQEVVSREFDVETDR